MQRTLQSEREEVVQQLLFIIFYFFMKDCYTACDRHLLKELLFRIQSIVRKQVMNNEMVELGFYLTVFEKQIGNIHQLKHHYNLLEMKAAKDHEI